MLYDPSVVTERVFEELQGLQTLAYAALRWMSGGGKVVPFIDHPEHWRAHSRGETARRLARLVELGWNCSICLLPLVVAINGADIQLRGSPLSAAETKRRQEQFRDRQRRQKLDPCHGTVILQESRIGVTWDFLLGFVPAEKKRMFGPGYEVECPWPAGSYRVTGWTLPEEEDPDTAIDTDQYLLQLEPWIPE